MLLSIQVPTVIGREQTFNKLTNHIQKCISLVAPDDIEFLSCKDNKEISIGRKRQLLYESSKGKYSWQIDDDDFITNDAIQLIYEACKEDADCITFQEKCIFVGQHPLIRLANHSIKYQRWAEHKDGFYYVRTPYFKDVIKTEHCLKAGVKDVRFGEDHLFAVAIKPLLKTEVHISKPLYIYEYSRTEAHNKKYGIK